MPRKAGSLNFFFLLGYRADGVTRDLSSMCNLARYCRCQKLMEGLTTGAKEEKN